MMTETVIADEGEDTRDAVRRAVALLRAGQVVALPTEINALWKFIAAEVPALATMRFGNIPETGLLLDHTAFARLRFAEGETLH